MNNEIEKKFRVENKNALKQLFSSPYIKNMYEFEMTDVDKVLDVYYDTPQMFLNNAGVLLRTRTVNKNKIITIKYETKQVNVNENSYSTCKEFEYKIPVTDSIYNYIDVITKNIPFSVYANLKVDLYSVMNSMKPFLVIDHKAQIYHVYSNTFKCQLIFSELKYVNQLNGKRVKECLIELQAYPKSVNFDKFFEFAKNIEKSVKPIYPYDKTKFEMGLEITKTIEKKK